MGKSSLRVRSLCDFPYPRAFLVACALGAAGCGAADQASDDLSTSSEPSALTSVVIIQDGFSGANDTLIAGQKPDVRNLPGGVWSVDAVNTGGPFSAFIDSGVGNPAPSLHFFDHANSYGSAAISIKSHNTYVKPAQFTLRADTRENSTSDHVALLFGFYANPPVSGANPINGFTGLALHTSNGSLDLVANGTRKATILYTGTFVATQFHNLSYRVNTSTGGISQVKLTGSTSNYNFVTTAFTNAATQYVAVGVEQGGSVDACSYIDNLIVET